MDSINRPNLAGRNTVPKARWRFSPVIIILAASLFVALAAAGYFFYQSKYAIEMQAANEIEEIVTTLGRFMELPPEETPTLATVTDRGKLAGQPFFQKAENGDKVLIYSSAGRAILYRPSLKKIIDVTSVNVNQTAPEGAAVPAAEPVIPAIVRVAIYNGTLTAGATSAAESQLKPAFPNVAVVTKANAAKQTYTQTIVMDVTGKNAEIAKGIATTLSGSVGSLPVGEKAPTDADILIILGGTQ